MSNPRGTGEGWQGDRFVNWMQYDGWSDALEKAGFEVLDHYYRPPGKPLNEQRWLAILAQACSDNKDHATSAGAGAGHVAAADARGESVSSTASSSL